ncbi:MAG: tetratricopeptide repeat protein [Deltaproteobacteria bacterium]|nr:tetratricopeptide repeat protein [Deltaproteobacteria bacterium]
MRAVLFAMAVLLAAGPLGAQPTQNDLLRQGIAAYDDLDYEESIRKLSAALLSPQNTPEDNLEIYKYLGLSYLLLEKPEQATGAFRNLLALAPDHHFDAATAPRIVEFFEQVRVQWEADGRPGVQELQPPVRRPVRILHVAPGEAARGSALALEVRVEDPDGLARGLFLNYRSGGRGAFTRVAVPPGPRASATVPAAAVRPGTVEYFFEVVDQGGAAIATRGDPEAPLRVVVPGPREGGDSILGRWWFWTGAAAVIGGGVALAIVLSSGGGGGSNPPIPDDRATVRINIVEAPE